MQLIGIALAVIFFDRSAAVCVDDQLEGQSLIAIGSDGDHIAAFENVCSGADVTFFGKCQNQCFGMVRIV